MASHAKKTNQLDVGEDDENSNKEKYKDNPENSTDKEISSLSTKSQEVKLKSPHYNFTYLTKENDSSSSSPFYTACEVVSSSDTETVKFSFSPEAIKDLTSCTPDFKQGDYFKFPPVDTFSPHPGEIAKLDNKKSAVKQKWNTQGPNKTCKL